MSDPIPDDVVKDIQHIELDFAQAKRVVTRTIESGLVPLLSGPPGVGKSALMKEIADDFNLELIDIRLSQCDPTDLN